MENDELDDESPCISYCVLDEDGMCIGCHRTIDEIERWQSMSSTEKRTIISLIKTGRSKRTG